MREKRIITWTVLLVVFMVIVNMPGPVSRFVKGRVRDAVAPLQQGVARGLNALREGGAAVRGFGGTVRENQRLSMEVARLDGENRSLRSLEQENATLRQQLGFRARGPAGLLPAEVIARDHDRWWQTLRIGRGEDDGIVTNLAVISVDGLVGRVIETSARTADVLLISDPTCLVAARVGADGAFGILAGRAPSPTGRALCAMDFINKDRPARSNDVVVTSGLGGIYPPGLVIGTVERVEMDSAGLCQRADVAVRADLGALRYVFVMGAGGGGAP